METVYVVMGLHPSHAMNEIKAVFKEKKKAEEYCFRHINCSIKEYSYSDDKTYTPLERVIIKARNLYVFFIDGETLALNFK